MPRMRGSSRTSPMPRPPRHRTRRRQCRMRRKSALALDLDCDTGGPSTMRFRSRVVTHTGTALVLALLGACSDEDAPDARVIPHFPDAHPVVTIDAPPPEIDAPPVTPDAPPPTFGATISIQEVAVLDNTATPIAALGTGGNINISFTQTNLPNEEF